MKFAIIKIQLSKNFPYKYYYNREELLGMNSTLDEAVVKWLTVTSEAHIFGNELNKDGKPVEWFSTGPDGDHCYVVLHITNPEVYRTINESPQMAKVVECANILFPMLGWQNLGNKVIEEYDDSIVKTYEVIDSLWNS